MVYPENIESKLEFNKVRQLVDGYCKSNLGKERLEQMHFSSDLNEIKIQLGRNEDFRKILESEDIFPADYFYDVRPVLKRIRLEGSWIDQQTILELYRSLQTIHSVVHFLQKDIEEQPKYPYLYDMTTSVVIYPEIVKRIEMILDSFGQIRDNASHLLADIRRQMTSVLNSISKNLNAILRQAQSEGFVEKDVSPSIRDGRLVIPVNPAFKRKIKGIVHDESASGKTVYIEPSEVVEANNRIRELENEERREIIRILTEFTNFLRPYLDDLLHSYEFLAEIDFVQAKAQFATLINGINPQITQYPELDWYRAVHPLLYLSLKKHKREIVPLNIQLNNENRILIISGPNAGGKSVCLKTVGLIQYMMQCGLPVAINENSRMGIFEDIFLDIGDEQSIENDLSTYSSHLTNMKYFVKNSSDKTLLLIDEFGGGTEPQIGAAIAQSLLDRFNTQKAFGVITTHYQNLKIYANEHEGVINGAMLYDRHNMQPLFQLSIGNPGSSFAIEIARKIGLPNDVIEKAAEIVGSDYVNMDRYLQDITRDRRYWERKRDEIRKKNKQIEQVSTEYQSQLDEINKQRKEILSKAKQDAEKLLSESNAVIENTIREIRRTQAEKEKTKAVRQSLNEFKDKLNQPDENKQQQKIKKPKTQKIEDKALKNEPLKVRDNVRLKGQNSIGEILDISGKKAVVAFGVIKSSIDIEKLEKVSNNQIKKEQKNISNTLDIMHDRKLNFKQDLDVRGLRVDEALQAVMYFVDDAIQLGIARVRILHGTGTGALRQAIRDYLKTINGVSHFQDEHVQFGGPGITVIDLE